MSLFGSSPPETSSPVAASNFGHSRSLLFEDESAMTKSTSSALFQDDDASGPVSPWDLPTPRKQKNRVDLLRSLLPASDVPESYLEIFDAVVRDSGSGGRVTSGGVARTLSAGHLSADEQARIMAIIAPGGDGGEVSLGRNEFNALLALIGLAQQGEDPNLDGVDERRRNLPLPKLPGLIVDNAPVLPDFSELGAKPPQRPVTPPRATNPPVTTPKQPRSTVKASMDYPEDPWGAPDLHKNHNHPALEQGRANGSAVPVNGNGNGVYRISPDPAAHGRTTSTFTTTTIASADGVDHAQHSTLSTGASPSAGGPWGYFDGSNQAVSGGFNEPSAQGSDPVLSPFGGGSGGSDGREPGGEAPTPALSRTLGGRTGSTMEETIVVSLLPEKEGLFFFQHHNYEVSNPRRGSKVVRRYSDFVWLLECLHKRYPFRALPLLPPKRVAVNGNHLSNDGAFIEKRRRGLARFLNGLVRHPVLGQEQLVIMFLTVPTVWDHLQELGFKPHNSVLTSVKELAVWRKQANLSVQDEFAGRPLPPGLEDSLPPSLEDLFDRTRNGVRRSADIYISICNLMDRLVKRSEGIANDHARLGMSLNSLIEVSEDTYATDTNDVPLLNDGLVAMSKHLSTGQSLIEDEAKAWDAGVLEDLKRQRDQLVSLRELFDRRERLDKDNIPYLEKRIQTNENKLTALRAKPEGLVKPGEIEKVAESIIKDKESIVNQHNRSIFVKECLRDELVYFQTTQYHVTHWNQDWAQERVKYSEMLADNWRRLLDELEGMPTGD